MDGADSLLAVPPGSATGRPPVREQPFTARKCAPAGEPMKVAIVHEWFSTYAGSERVVEQMLHVFPQAEVFGVVDFLPRKERAFLGGRPVHTTFIQRMPFARRFLRAYLPLMPIAIEQLDVSGYDLVISSSHAVAKGVLTGPDQLHVCMCYSPMRYAWDLQHQYLGEAKMNRFSRGLARMLLHYLRMWDVRTASAVDVFITNSAYIGRRVRKVYGRESTVIPPPVDIDGFSYRPDKGDYYLAAARMVPYKRMPLIVEAFSNMPDRRLVVIGEGPDLKRCQQLATPNIELLGPQPFKNLRDYMQGARAFVFAAEEDFGITMVEAQACGTPVIAFGRGGASEIVRVPGGAAPPTGVFFLQQTADAIVRAVNDFEALAPRIEPAACRRNAQRFTVERFRRSLEALVEGALAERGMTHASELMAESPERETRALA